MNWNNIPNNERLHLWKKFRTDLVGLDLDKQMAAVAEFFARVPYAARTLDYYTPSEWPTPWEILFHGSFCTSSISLLMFYTFELSHTDHLVELYLVEDDSIYLIPVIDKKFVLNYELGTVNNYSEVEEDFTVLQIYRTEIKTLR